MVTIPVIFYLRYVVIVYPLAAMVTMGEQFAYAIFTVVAIVNEGTIILPATTSAIGARVAILVAPL